MFRSSGVRDRIAYLRSVAWQKGESDDSYECYCWRVARHCVQLPVLAICVIILVVIVIAQFRQDDRLDEKNFTDIVKMILTSLLQNKQ